MKGWNNEEFVMVSRRVYKVPPDTKTKKKSNKEVVYTHWLLLTVLAKCSYCVLMLWLFLSFAHAVSLYNKVVLRDK